MKIIITINGIDTCSLGDWGDRDLDSVASEYQQFLAQKIEHELASVDELPDNDVEIRTERAASTLQYNVNISGCTTSEAYDVEEQIRDILTYNLEDSWDQFCNQESK